MSLEICCKSIQLVLSPDTVLQQFNMFFYIGGRNASRCVAQHALEVAGSPPVLTMLHSTEAGFTSMVLQWPMLSGMAAQDAGAPGARHETLC